MFEVSGQQYYVKYEDGDDSRDCKSFSSPCKTIQPDKLVIDTSFGSSTTYLLYITEYTTLSSKWTIDSKSSGQTIISSYTPNVAEVNIQSSGQFELKGIVNISKIKFTLDTTAELNSIITTAFFLMSLSEGGTILDRCEFSQCKAPQGGALTITQNVNNQFKITSCNFTSCSSTTGQGGAIYATITYSSIQITNSQFNQCNSKTSGGALYIYGGGLTLSNVQFIGCHADTSGGAIEGSCRNGTWNIGQCQFNGCYSTGKGGALQITIGPSLYGNLQVQQCSFTGCYSTTDSGGAIYSEIHFGDLNIQSGTTFDTCNCTQPGYGAAIATSQLGLSSKIFISGATFRDCKTLQNSSNPTYGWGSGIYIYTILEIPNFNNTNFQLSNLIFTGCEAVNKYGHHIHIQSPNTTDTGQAIKNQNMITVSGASDIYTSANYPYEYMGIDTSNAGTGTIDSLQHLDLFRQHYISNVSNPCYIDATNGVNVEYCGGQRYKCNTIAHAIDRNTTPSSEIAPSKDTNFKLILTTIASNDNSLQISVPHTYYNYITIQSNGYVSGGTGYTKYKIPTTSNSNSLFSVTDVGLLELLGLQFDNLKTSNPAASAPLISASTSTTSSYCITIIDCEFAHVGSQNLAHSIISINGGKIFIQKTKFINYQFTGTMNTIVIQSASSSSIVELEQVAFTDITQSGTGNGAAINAILNSGSSLKVSSSCTFTRCKSTNGLGGAIYSTLSGGEVELNQVTFSSCQSKSGGAVYSTISGDGKLTITNQCSFTSCSSTENGGAIYASLSSITGSGGISFTGTASTFTSCVATQNGGGIYCIINSGEIKMNEVTLSECSGLNGGGIYSTISGSGKQAIKDLCSFDSCTCTTGSGGAIYSSISNGELNIDNTTFTSCTCTQPGNGGALAIEQLGTGKIIINDVEFTLCKTLTGNGNYGWGGAIFIKTSVAASSLTLDNFKLTDLQFSSDCSSFVNAGHYIDIQSLDTADTGANIETKQLLTVNGTTNIYTNETYRILYMGIKTDDVNGGQNSPFKHCPLFTTCNIGEYYVKTGGNNSKGCFDSSINHCLNFDAVKLKGDSNLNGVGKYIVYVVDSTTIPNKLEITQASTEFPRTFRNDGGTSTSLKPIEFSPDGQFDINGGNVLFNYINFVVVSNVGSMILIRTSSSQASLYNCQLNLGDLTSISHNFIERQSGNVIINFLNTPTTKAISSVIDIIAISANVGNISITSGSFGTTTYGISSTSNRLISASVGGSLAQKLEISTSSFTQCINTNGNGGALNFVIGSGGEVQLNKVTFNSCQSKSGGAVYSTISGDGKLTITNQCSFTSCSSTENGGAIYASLSSGASGSVSIIGSASTFSSCTVSTSSGLGGAIYLDLASGTETQYDLTGASYSTGNSAQYGNNLFINAFDLGAAVPMNDASATKSKIGAGLDSYEKANPTNLMGYDSVIGTLAIPLYYVYTTVNPLIFHVNNLALPFQIGSGNNNKYCGHLGWPCLTIDYSIQLTGNSIEKKIGIISEYKIDSFLEIDQSGKEVKIINSLSDSGDVTDIKSILNIEDQGKFSVTNGTLTFDKITFSININSLEGYIITGSTQSTKIQIDNCIMKTTTASSTIKTGLVEVVYGILSITNLNIEDIVIQDRSIIKVDEGANVGIVNIIESTFENITRTGDNQKGGVIEGYLGSNNGQLRVSSTFEECKVSNTDGLGGAIYIKISDDLLNMFDLSGTSYSGCNGKYGKSLFIEAYNLRTAVPIHTESSLTKTKIGAESDEYEKANLYNLMGYDNNDLSVAIPLYYVYTDIDSQVYHVSNSDSTPNGNDNQFCRPLQWPCLTIDYVITLTGSTTPKQIGIIDGFKLSSFLEIDQSDKEIQISNQLSDSGDVTDIKSILNIEDQGKIQLTAGTLSFQKIIFNINENATQGYIISGTTQILLTDCIMKMTSDTAGYSIQSGFIELNSGNLNIDNLEVKDIIISDSPIILINENAGSINIIDSQFDNITRTASDSTIKIGGTIESTIGGSSGQLTIQNTNFTLCISEQSYQAGALSLIIKNQRTISISQSSFIQCESDQGSGINAQILTGGTLTIDGTSSFICCKARLDLGSSLYSTISGTNSKLILNDGLLFEGYIKNQDQIKQTQFGQGGGAYIEISNNGIIEANEIIFNECKGINGGGIQINCQSTLKQTFNGTQFTSCVATQNGGGIYCIINSGEIEMNEVTFSGCSGLNGGGIYSTISGSGKLTIKDSCSFTSCSSTCGNGGGIYIDIDFSTQSQILVQSTKFEFCQALNPQISDINKGYGSGIFISGINWDNINNAINLGQVEYNNCKADQGDKGL
ncbi:MAG: hypothetical protein EZS28_015780, partial [Streblomastix strix]